MALELTVDIRGERRTKMRFPMTSTVQDMLKEIWANKIGKSEKDHGIFLPKETTRKGKSMWLDPVKTLRFYDLHDGVRPHSILQNPEGVCISRLSEQRLESVGALASLCPFGCSLLGLSAATFLFCRHPFVFSEYFSCDVQSPALPFWLVPLLKARSFDPRTLSSTRRSTASLSIFFTTVPKNRSSLTTLRR